MANNSTQTLIAEDEIKKIDNAIDILKRQGNPQSDSPDQAQDIQRRIADLESQKAKIQREIPLQGVTTPTDSSEKNEDTTHSQEGKGHSGQHDQHQLHKHTESEGKTESQGDSQEEPKKPSLVKKVGKGVFNASPVGIATRIATGAVKSSKPESRTIGKSTEINFTEGQEGIGFSVGEDRGHAGQIEKQVSSSQSVTAGASMARKEEPKKPSLVKKVGKGVFNASPVGIATRIATRTTRTTKPPVLSQEQSTSAQTDQKNETDATTSAASTPQQPAESPPTRTGRAQQPKKPNPVTKGAGKVLMYTSPGGFLIGKIAPRIKERFFAKKETEQMEKQAQAGRSETKGSTTKKKSTRAARFVGKLGYYTSIGGLTHLAAKAFLPKRSATEKPKTKKSEIPPRNPFAIRTGTRKTAKQYIQQSNTETLQRAKRRGYDPLALFRKIRDAKIWNTRSWKGAPQTRQKPQLGPIGTRNPFAISRLPKRSSNESPELARFLPRGLHGGINPGFGQQRIFRSVWSSAGSPFSRINRSLGGRFGERRPGSLARGATRKVAGKAEQKLAQQLAKKLTQEAVVTFLKTPAGWTVLGVIAVVFIAIIFFGTILIIFSSGDSAKALGGTGGETNPETPGTTAPPITGFKIDKEVDKTTATLSDEIHYTITYSYTPPAGSLVKLEAITIYDTLVPEANLISASGAYKYNETTRTLSWPLSDPQNTVSQSLTLTVKPARDNVEIKNKAYALAISPGSGIIDISSGSLAQIFKDSATNSSIPLPFLKAIAKKESEVLKFTDSDVEQFNKKDWWQGLRDNAPSMRDNDPLVLKGYAYNTCQYTQCAPGSDVRGAMQFEIGTWDEIKSSLSFSDGHSPERKYIRDVVYGAGKNIRRIINTYDNQFHFSNNPNDWTEEQVKAAARAYCGGNPGVDVSKDPACGPYDTLVWQYYNEFKTAGN